MNISKSLIVAIQLCIIKNMENNSQYMTALVIKLALAIQTIQENS